MLRVVLTNEKLSKTPLRIHVVEHFVCSHLSIEASSIVHSNVYHRTKLSVKGGEIAISCSDTLQIKVSIFICDSVIAHTSNSLHL